MTEIDKMFENAGINKREIENCTYKNSTPCGHFCDDGEDCPYLEIKNDYPPFTAEKQLEITKLIGSRYGLKFIVNEAMDYMLSTDLFNDDKFNIQGYGYGYDEAIANLTNNLWQDLTNQEKQEIRRILNENS